ncbi:MAG: Rieske 2Fe-2S domain-containing protein [Pseudonocardiales bacterium]|nr:Rieske 2Fe-2S domain-containing protein [Pseudonocardiales bacterium]MBV9730348.1 Rieske 2Fe-2S domain-containing protein [Pseudonocardiales bacterium]
MSARGVRRFVADLLAGRRPRSFRADDTDVGPLRAAITLRAARPGSTAPGDEFVTDLHRRLAAAQTDQDVQPLPLPRPVVDGTRRRLVAATSIAAAAAAVGAVADHALTSRSPAPSRPGGQQTLLPNTGEWRTVSTSADLAEGGVRGFDLGTVVGFVARTGGALRAVSGVCTHLGCRLALNAPARRLDCPCHTTSFALNGELLRYQLAVPPPALPQLEVRETQGVVQVYAPPGPVV